jgi:hypothetical protein
MTEDGHSVKVMTPAERLKAMLKVSNRGVEVTGALEPSPISLLKRCAPPLDESQTAMSVEFKISTDEYAKKWAKELTGNENMPVIESGSGSAAYVAKRHHSVELTTNATTTIGERALLDAGKVISWIEAAGGDASYYEDWVKRTWGKGVETSLSSYKLLLTPGWHKEVMMEHDKPESAAYSLYNYMSMVKAEFNNFPKAYFGEDSYVPWHKYAVALKAIGAINIAASQHRDRMNQIKGKAMWFVPSKVTTRNLTLKDFCIDTSPFKDHVTTLPKNMIQNDLDRVRDLSDWTFFESMSILKKSLKQEDFNDEEDDTSWVDNLISHALSVRKRRMLLAIQPKMKDVKNWESLAENEGILVSGQVSAINVYERKLLEDPVVGNAYTHAVADILLSVGSSYRAYRDRDTMAASLGRHIKDVFKNNGTIPLFSFVHKDYQDIAVRITADGYRSSKCEQKYKFAHIANQGVLIERHRTLNDMVRHAFGVSSYSDEMFGIFRTEESYGIWLDMNAPIIDVSLIRQPELQTPKGKKEVVLLGLKKHIDDRFERHYRSRINLLEHKFKLSENTKQRVNRKRYQFLLKYHKYWKINEKSLKGYLDWQTISPMIGDQFKRFLRKSKEQVYNGVTEEEINPKTEEQTVGLAMTIDDQHNPEFKFYTALRILEREIGQKEKDLARIKESAESDNFHELSYLNEPLVSELIEDYDELEAQIREKDIKESEESMKSMDIDAFALALLEDQEEPFRESPLRPPLDNVIAEKGYSRDDVRSALGILDWNEVLGQYERGELVINDIDVAIQNSRLMQSVDKSKVVGLDNFLASL